MMSKKYYSNINSLKGLCAVSVALSHFLCAFYPRISLGDESISHYGGVESVIAQPPLFALINGSFMVYVFWTISGYLLTKKFMALEKENLSGMLRTILNKYFRLIPCILIINIFIYVVVKSGIQINASAAEISKSDWLFSWFHSSAPEKDFFLSTFYSPWFRGASVYNGSLWTMRTELYGSFFLASVLALMRDIRDRDRVIYLMIMVCFFTNCDYLTFFVGALIAGDGNKDKKQVFTNRKKYFRYVILFVVALFLGSYHPIVYIGKQIWIPDVLNYGLPYHTYGLLYVIGSAMIVFVAVNFHIEKENRITKWLGNRSMYIYVCHAPLISFIGSYVLVQTSRWFDYFLSTMFVFFISGFVIGGVAEILYRIDKWTEKWYQPLKLLKL